ncbi:MAG TPA: tripartite tricarboxylate transporter substrate binding protein [Paenalcaligenes sp.]|nr:tripartite tricarboxylate transporter substrate binding protein [Paenalcaligenes sp.]
MKMGLLTLCTAIMMSLVPGAQADNAYPQRPIKIIVPYTPGDGPDITARLIGDHIAQQLGQPVVIENKPGASGQIGLAQTARAEPDGYTLGVGLVTNLSLAPHAYKDVSYSSLEDFSPVALVAMNYLALVTRPDAPFENVTEMIGWAQDHPGELSVGTTSVGGLPHMSLEMLAHQNDFTFLNVPYQGNSAIVTDLMGGLLDIGLNAYTSIADQIESGKLKLLGITYPERDPQLPELPAISEFVDGYSSTGWFGIVAPAGVPEDILEQLNLAINEAIESDKMQKTMHTLGLIPVTESKGYFAQFLEEEDEKFARLVKDIGYEPM